MQVVGGDLSDLGAVVASDWHPGALLSPWQQGLLPVVRNYGRVGVLSGGRFVRGLGPVMWRSSPGAGGVGA